jgi:copper chaperone
MHRFKVGNMTCGHCASMIEKAVKSIDPQAVVVVDLGKREVTIRSGADAARIAEVIRSAGYENERIAA